MIREKSIIEVKKPIPPVFHEHLASLNLGYSMLNSSVIYRQIETGKEYLHLAGSIFWPGKINPGFILVMGVRAESDQIIYECLDEDSDKAIDNLLRKCITLRDRYGFRQTDKLFRYWYGDPNRFSTLLNQFNQRLRDKEVVQDGIYLSPPMDFEKENHFELYLCQMQSALMPNNTGRKSLYLGSCHSLRNAIQNLPTDAATRFTEDDCPAIAAAGSLIHSLSATTPWTYLANEPIIIHNDFDDFEEYVLHERNIDHYYE
ncbi:MAG: hypothetical protein WAW31_06475 [Smithella sp.]